MDSAEHLIQNLTLKYSGAVVNGMEKRSAVKYLFITLIQNVTIIGKLWFVLLITLRVLVLLFAGFPLYVDEQERFVCNTLQPGCAAMCYDLFSPISPLRLWLLQLAALCLPCAAFGVYVIHKVTLDLEADRSNLAVAQGGPPFQGTFGKNGPSSSVSQMRRGEEHTFAAAYFLHLLLQVLLETGFGLGQYYLFGINVPRRILCHEAPCTTVVDCYASRPTEKTAMLHFMLWVSAFSVLLDVADLACAARRWVSQVRRRRMLVEKMYEEAHYYLSTDSQGMDAHIQVALDPGMTATFDDKPDSSSNVDDKADEVEPLSPPREPRVWDMSNSVENGVSPQACEKVPEQEDKEAALCPSSPPKPPRQLRICKRSHLRPPPPPRRDLPTKAFCTKRVGQYTLVEMTAPELQANCVDGQDKRSEWV
ncbi:gap junction delta-4 protein-like [Arapaima gigas]